MGLQRAYQQTLGYSCWKLTTRDTGALIGFCGLAPLVLLDEVEIGWWLKPAFWGKGLAIEAAVHVANHAQTAHGLSRFVARAYSENSSSIRIMQKLGMTYARDLETNARGTVVLYEKSADQA